MKPGPAGEWGGSPDPAQRLALGLGSGLGLASVFIAMAAVLSSPTSAHAAATSSARATEPAGSEDDIRGDPIRGRALVLHRGQGLCVLCHAVPGAAAHEQGTLGPDLAGVASRHDRATLRRRLVEPQAFNPETIMPGYGPAPRTGARVAPPWAGRPLLDAQGLADVLAFLETLR